MTRRDDTTRDTKTGSVDRCRLVNIVLDEKSLARAAPDIEHERKVAIFDLLEDNLFAPIGNNQGPYTLILAIMESRLVFDVRDQSDTRCSTVLLSLKPFRKIVRDYFLICESYFEAIKTAPLSRIEAIDMGRRGIHNEGSELLRSRLDGKIDIDFDTARRLFTLISALHWKG
jgi:uncharacterized protein (UPF0262 family)